jgi:hypothetical protein
LNESFHLVSECVSGADDVNGCAKFRISQA